MLAYQSIRSRRIRSDLHREMAAVAGSTDVSASTGTSLDGGTGRSSVGTAPPPATSSKPTSATTSAKDRRIATLRLVSDMKRLQEDAPPVSTWAN